MMRRFGAAAFLTALLVLSGCSSFAERLRAWQEGLKVPTEDIDYSYPVSGNVAAQGTIVFKYKPGFWEKLFHNPEPPVPANESEIVVYLGFVVDFSRIFDWRSGWIPPEQSGGEGRFLLGETDGYVGKCDILFGNASRKGEIVIWKNPSETSANVPTTVLLDSATTETISVEMNDYISSGKTSHVVRSMPPYLWGKLVLSGRAYRIFSVIEESYYAMYPDFSQRERGTVWHGLRFGFAGSRVETTAHNFLRDEQKFQVLDNSGEVVAELRRDSYTLYDTLPQTEWEDMKQALALFYAFRYIAERILY
jgi:hypothetical protein